VFSDDFISEPDALAILESSHAGNPTYTADFSSRESAAAKVPASGDGNHDGNEDEDDAPILETYELINSAPWRYLCSVPVIAPQPLLNQTATELAKAEEARELSRASAKGWELMSGLDGHCMYFVSGWWSYSFCYGKGVVQFHAVPSGTKGAPPMKDEKSLEYVLGIVRHDQQETAVGNPGEAKTKSVAPPKAHLQVNGDQRYLVQRLDGGTVCDLTGRPRTIEVQYHCSPGASGDRIGWIKEVTTCTYLMVVQTPRLCADVAFQPAKQTRAHPIRCSRIVGSEEEESAWHYHQRVEAGESLTGAQKENKAKEASANPFVGMTIGGVVVGGQKVLGGLTEDGTPAHKLALPRHISTAKTPLGEIVAAKKKDGTKLSMSDEDLKKRNLDPEKIEEMRQKLQKLAGEGGWTIEVIEYPEGLELVGNFDGMGQKEDQKAEGEKTGDKDAAGQDEEDQQGSQEVFFKEEL
jgi:protein OS-9